MLTASRGEPDQICIYICNKLWTKIEILIFNTEVHVLLIINHSIPFNATHADYISSCDKSVRLGMEGEINVFGMEERKSATYTTFKQSGMNF